MNGVQSEVFHLWHSWRSKPWRGMKKSNQFTELKPFFVQCIAFPTFTLLEFNKHLWMAASLRKTWTVWAKTRKGRWLLSVLLVSQACPFRLCIDLTLSTYREIVTPLIQDSPIHKMNFFSNCIQLHLKGHVFHLLVILLCLQSCWVFLMWPAAYLSQTSSQNQLHSVNFQSVFNNPRKVHQSSKQGLGIPGSSF